MGPVLYYLGHTGHTFAVIHYKDENEDKSIVVESNPDQNNHNRVVITPLKYFVFPEKFYKVKGVEVQIPEYISYEDILNEITMDKGEYDLSTLTDDELTLYAKLLEKMTKNEQNDTAD